MPYIKENDRPPLAAPLNAVPKFKSKGELEYCIYYLMLKFMKDRDYRYDPLHDCVYAGFHASHEFERNTLDKREGEAKKQNGEIVLL